MSEKKFKALHATGKELVVESNGQKEFFLHTTHNNGDFFAVEDAPAIALAILEAAGYGSEVDGTEAGSGVYWRSQYAKEQEAAKREAESQKALTDEAEALFEAFRTGRGDYSLGLVPWDSQPSEVQQRFRQDASRARKLHGASK